MKYYIVAGEESGDLHASNLIKNLKQKDPNAQFRGWGGDKMKTQGCDIQKHISELAFMGFVEVIKNLRTILRNIKQCKKDILEYQPDVVLLIDYPGVNLRLAAFTKQNGIKNCFYISPQVWAWKESRVVKMRKNIDLLITILPFETEFFKKHQIDVSYVGHPLLDALEDYDFQEKNTFYETHTLADKPIIALLPGSRKQEIEKMLPIMLEVSKRMNDFQFVIGGVSFLDKKIYTSIFESTKTNPSILFDSTYNLIKNAKIALVTSGTATLETALIQTPQIVCYKGSKINYWIGKQLIKLKFISLVNLIMDKEVVKELIQYDMNQKLLLQEIQRLQNEDVKSQMQKEYKELISLLGGKGASERASNQIFAYISG